MAEIKIKKKSHIWPWIVFLVIILAILAYYFIYSDNISSKDDIPLIEQDEQIENSTGENHLHYRFQLYTEINLLHYRPSIKVELL